MLVPRHVLPRLLAAGLLLVLAASCCPPSRESAELTGPAASKVDPDLRRRAGRLLAEARALETVQVLVRVTGPEARTDLESAGMRVESLVGDVATGELAAGALARVAALETVVHIHPARRLQAY